MATLKLNSQTVVTESSGTLTAPALNITTGTHSGTILNSATFPAGMVLQTVRDNYTSQTETSSEVKVHELTLTTKKANSKLAFWFNSAIGGTGDGDNINLRMTLETGATASTPSSSNFLPSDNRGAGTYGQDYARNFYLDVMPVGTLDTYYMHSYAVSDVIITSYAKDTQITMGAFIQGSCYINRCENRANIETGLTTLIVQEIAT